MAFRTMDSKGFTGALELNPSLSLASVLRRTPPNLSFLSLSLYKIAELGTCTVYLDLKMTFTCRLKLVLITGDISVADTCHKQVT
jgi:hypothetical protein